MQIYYQEYSLQIDALPVTLTEIQTETLKDKTLVNVLLQFQNCKRPDKTNDDIKRYYNKWNELAIEDLDYTMGSQSYCTRTIEK